MNDQTRQYLIADSKAHIAALRRATDPNVRDLICKAIKRNQSSPTRSEGSTSTVKVSG